MSEFKTCQEAVWADDRHKELTTKIGEAWLEADKINKEIRPLLWNLQALLRAADLCDQYYFREAEPGECDTLKRLTGEGAECWEANWDRSSDAIKEAAVALCSTISYKECIRKGHRDKHTKLNQERDALAIEIRTAWHKQKEGV